MYNQDNYNYDTMKLHSNSKEYILYKGTYFNTYAALIVFILYMIAYILCVVLGFKNNINVGLFILFFGIIYIPTFILITYDLDCVFSGFCNTWGYIRTILTCIILIIIIGILIFFMTLDKELLNYISEIEPEIEPEIEKETEIETEIITTSKIE